MTRFDIAIRITLLFFVSGCVADTYERAAVGHDEAEIRVTENQIVAEWDRQGEWYVAPAVEAHDGITRVGVLLALKEPGAFPRMQARLSDGGTWSDIDSTWAEEDHHVGTVDFEGSGERAQVRILASDLSRVLNFRFHAGTPEAIEQGDDSDSEPGLTSAPLRTELTGLGIVTRESWGARSTRCNNRNASKSRMAIHHTVTNSVNPARQMRAIQNYHMNSRGWCDVGYHFLIGSDGKVYEGRPLHLLGSHVGRNNTGNIGISFIGCFNSSGCSGLGNTTPPENMINAAGNLVRELSRVYGIPVNSSTVKGHRDHSGASTSCPGSNLHRRLSDIRQIGTAAGPTPTPTPTPTPEPTPPPTPTAGDSCTHTYGGTYGHGGCSAGYVCDDGRWRVRSSATSCSCEERTGRVGCNTSGPPPGASCTHTYGGSYANTACSPSYQCCNGRWGTRGSCGSCYCEESSGRAGCGT